MVKKVLLRVATVLAEMVRAEFLQFAGAEFAAARKVFFPQDALDPDVDRESTQSFVGEEHHAIGYLGTDSGQLAKPLPQLVIWQRAPRLEICFPARHSLGRREEIFRAIAEPTIPQLFLRCARHVFRGREGIYVSLADAEAGTKTPAQL